MKYENHSLIISVDALLEDRMYFILGEKLLIDEDAAEVLQISLKQLQRIVREKRTRFPKEFLLQLTVEETGKILPYHHRRRKVYAFTWGGFMMLSGQVKTKRAIDIHLQLIRAFGKGIFEKVFV